MCGKILISALTLMGLMSPIISVSLTKEIPISALAKNQANIGELITNNLLVNPESGLASLAALLTEKSNPEVSDVLSIFNNMFQSELLVVKGDYIELDQASLKSFVQARTKQVLKTLFPNNPLQQFAYLAALQGPLEKALADLATQSNRLSVAQVQALLDNVDARTRGLSRADTRSIIDEIYKAVSQAACNLFVEQLLSQVETVLNTIISTLSDITSGIDLEIVTNAVYFIESASSEIIDYAQTVGSNYCSNLTLSRKRRDLEETRVVALEPSGRTDVAFVNILLGVLDVILGFVFQQLNSLAKSWASSFITDVVQVAVDDFLQNQVLSAIYAIIDTVLVYQ